MRILTVRSLSKKSHCIICPPRRFLTTASHISSSTTTTTTTTMPPGFTAKTGQIQHFTLPEKVSGSIYDIFVAKAMISAWRRDGILLIDMSDAQRRIYDEANAASKDFFQQSPLKKQSCADIKSYSGYTASGEEMTDGVADYPEIFTVYEDLPETDAKVRAGWPCHGPCPWPNDSLKSALTRYMKDHASSSRKILQLLELGLKVPTGALTKCTEDGWHHLRMLRFPQHNCINGKGKYGRGIGSHTDYGLLVTGTQDNVGGLFVRPPNLDDNRYSNWEKNAAGFCEDDTNWVYVPPTSGAFTVILGDMMQYMTNSFLKATPHKVGLNTQQRFSFAYFYEPNFRSIVKPLPGYNSGQSPIEGIHYGTHFTNMNIRNFPHKETTLGILESGRYELLNSAALRQID